ncbi:MAG: efflux RND transporter periplasmic adaptor subunit [Candidatus Sungbacteria bacterium]|uniref:Efflux RND transporter periplasmic adaptor subunit n=1 Tax=Candidatus Sungiibacteriota bacterium TaxID=2750080 RepID=A0A931YDX8_9BACT|nr:efflux RND transporter periplasmic adaptor subunit [Candidatus Sungbacteria bacterium]
MKTFFKKIITHKYVLGLVKYVSVHKLISLIIGLGVMWSGYWGIGVLTDDGSETRYVLAAAERGTLTVSLTGSGQVSASDQVDVKTKVSGDVVYVGLKNGDAVKAGTLIAQLDARDALKTVRDAEANLESAKIALAKLKKPADDLSLIQAQNSFDQARENLEKSYDDGFNSVADAFLELPEVMQGLQDILYGTDLSAGQSNVAAYSDMVKTYNPAAIGFKTDAEIKYTEGRNAYDKSFNIYKSASRFSGNETVKNLIGDVYETTKLVAEAVKSADNLLSLVKDEMTERNLAAPVLLADHQALLSDYTGKTNAHLNSLLSAKDTIISSGRAVSEKTEALEKLKQGADELDLSSQELTVRQKENALKDAREKLADYYIRAPFEGTLAKLDTKKSDNVSAGSIAATIITSEKFAEISLNEIDIAKIKMGQKAALTFDAVDGLTLAGEVAEADIVGTVSQGVVTYNIKIGFNADDERIKPGMSVTAEITTNVKENVLMVPASAVKTQGRMRYVETINQAATGREGLAQTAPGVVLPAAPRRQPVEVGLSGETNIEIINGLNEGDKVVVRTIAPASVSAAPSAPSIFGSPTGGNRGGGGNIRIPR